MLTGQLQINIRTTFYDKRQLCHNDSPRIVWNCTVTNASDQPTLISLKLSVQQTHHNNDTETGMIGSAADESYLSRFNLLFNILLVYKVYSAACKSCVFLKHHGLRISQVYTNDARLQVGIAARALHKPGSPRAGPRKNNLNGPGSDSDSDQAAIIPKIITSAKDVM